MCFMRARGRGRGALALLCLVLSSLIVLLGSASAPAQDGGAERSARVSCGTGTAAAATVARAHRRAARRARNRARATHRRALRKRLLRSARRHQVAARRSAAPRCAIETKKKPPPPAPTPTPTPTVTPAPTPTATPTPAPTATPMPTPAPAATPTPSPALTVTASSADATALIWTPAPGAAVAEVLRDGRLIDRVPASAGAYTDRLLWPSTSYAYTLRQLTAEGTLAGSQQTSAATPARGGLYPRLFADDAFVNTRIAAAPALADGSATIVSKSITAYQSSANLANSSWWGVPIALADSSTKRFSVGCTLYFCNISWSPQAIPSYAAPTEGSDHHLTVLDPAAGTMLDMWAAEKLSDGWRAGTRWVSPAKGSAIACDSSGRCGGANAANFALMAGVVRPEEIAQGRIEHALVITTPYTRSDVIACPATHTDGRNASVEALPMGARVQLDPAVNVDALALPAWKKTIARALQEYGAYVGDTGGSLAVRGESTALRGYDAWAKAGVSSSGPSLKDLPWDRLRVLSYSRC